MPFTDSQERQFVALLEKKGKQLGERAMYSVAASLGAVYSIR